MAPNIHLSVDRAAFFRRDDDEPRDENDPLSQVEQSDEALDTIADRVEVGMEQTLVAKFGFDVAVTIGDLSDKTTVNYCTIDEYAVSDAGIDDINAWILRALADAIDHVWGRDH